jgi:mRNA-degrading endonuclease RelE of RelBE toxin-antitoxin system
VSCTGYGNAVLLAMFEFIETPFFTKAIARYLDDEDYAKLQAYLNEHPEIGAIVPSSGGVRKMRWAAEGRGKRGGLRVIYYLVLRRGQIWMLTVYGKNVHENIPAHLLKRMREAIDDAKDD